MKKYLLSLHGDFKSKEMCKDIATAVTPIVDSPHLKFSHKSGNLLLCFDSEVDREELYSYIEGSLYGLFDYFILSVVDDNLSVCMDESTKGHLFDTVNDSENPDFRIDMTREMFGSEEREIYTEEEDAEFLNDILTELKSKIRKPSIDEILDKIKEKGVESITPYEKDILDNYGK